MHTNTNRALIATGLVACGIVAFGLAGRNDRALVLTLPSYIVDDGDAGFSAKDYRQSAYASAYGSDVWYVSMGTTGLPIPRPVARWTVPSVPAGSYSVYATWGTYAGGATDAYFTAKVFEQTPGTPLLVGSTAPVTANQTKAPGSYTANGRSWLSIGSVSTKGNTQSIVVELTAGSKAFTLADAVMIMPNVVPSSSNGTQASSIRTASSSAPTVPVPPAASSIRSSVAAVTNCRTMRPSGTPWQNQRDPYDVNGDGLITNADALAIMNTINESQSRTLGGNPSSTSTWYDVNGDGWVAPVDMLAVSNFLTCMNVPTVVATNATASSSSAPTVPVPPAASSAASTPAITQCSDGIDNDGDGAMDRSDPGCSQSNLFLSEEGTVSLTMTMTTASPTIRPGGQFPVSITVKNSGPDTVTRGTAVRFNPPIDARGLAANMRLFPAGSHSGCTETDGVVTCTLPDRLAAGGTITFSIAYTQADPSLCSNIYATNQMKSFTISAATGPAAPQTNPQRNTFAPSGTNAAAVTTSIDCTASSASSASSISSAASSASTTRKATLKCIRIANSIVTVDYEQSFTNCAHIVSTATKGVVHRENLFCNALGFVTEPQSGFNDQLAIGAQVTLCNGNDKNDCSAPVTVEAGTCTAPPPLCQYVSTNRGVTTVIVRDDAESSFFTPGSFGKRSTNGNGGSHSWIPWDPYGTTTVSPATWDMGPLGPGYYRFGAFWPTGADIGGTGIYTVTAWKGETIIAKTQLPVDAAVADSIGGCSNGPAMKGTMQPIPQFNLRDYATRVSVTLEPSYNPNCQTDACARTRIALAGKRLAADTVVLELIQAQNAPSVCGNGTKEIGEVCDDGNLRADDYCAADCATVSGWCGDRTIQSGAGEECDDIVDSCKACKKVAIPTECNDGKDNDGDGMIDARDHGCHTDKNASNTASYSTDIGVRELSDAGYQSCGDAIDNDYDGFTDRLDPGCYRDGNVLNPASYDQWNMFENANSPARECTDSLDNDGDGLKDAQEPACHHDANVMNLASFRGGGTWTNDRTKESDVPQLNLRCMNGSCTSQPPGTCGDGKDNNNNALVDEQDPSCHADANATNRASFNPLLNEATTSTQAGSSASASRASSSAPSAVARATVSIDNSDAGFSVSNAAQWSIWSDSGPQKGSYLWGGAGTSATWNMGTVAPGTYALEATWYGYPSASNVATYVVNVEGQTDQTFTANQSRSTSSTFAWQTLSTTVTVSASRTVRVMLTAGDGSPLFADSIRLVPLP